MKIKLIIIQILIVFIHVVPTLGQVNPNPINVHINSNNPKFPFPQFLDYHRGRTLGRDNADGVTDIEMEKTTREAYQIMMNRASYTGTIVAGTRYIVFNPPGLGFTGPEPDVTEGDGYALLAAAYMADKPTFDGLYMYVNDSKASRVELFSTCGVIRNPNYKYGVGTKGWRIGNNDAASDGDFDIAMALLVAYRQWPNDGILDACGNKRLYKDLALGFLKTITDTVFAIHDTKIYNDPSWICNPPSPYWNSCPYGPNPDPRIVPSPDNAYLSGDIGWDGYVKNGNTFPDVTNFVWSGNSFTWSGNNWRIYKNIFATKPPYIDYVAPSYFRAFADFLESENPVTYAWNIYQFRRAEASSDWLMGQIYAKGLYPTGGHFTVNADGSQTTFGDDASPGEDARNPWRTIANYIWYGNPTTSWNPVTHQVVPGANTYEYDNAMRLANFAQLQATCIKLGNDPTELQFRGPATLGKEISVNGIMTTGPTNHYNWNYGSFAPSIVAYHYHQNNTTSKDLLSDWYNRLVLMWDADFVPSPVPDNRYIASRPKYFHGWFRLLGLLVTTGNYHSPAYMAQPINANVKVYLATDKTVASGPIIVSGNTVTPGDIITYTISYRNYSSVVANNVNISYPLPLEVEFVSASNGGTLSGSTVTWNIGSIPGYTSTGETGLTWNSFNPKLYNTYGEVTLKVRVKAGQENKIICNQATITATNSSSHTSNEFPNNDTPTFEKNCVNIIARNLTISKIADRNVVANGDVFSYEINFCNSSGGGWINGGRPDVRVTYSYGLSGPNANNHYFRVLHGAQEPYINPGNYRVSYFLNDEARVGIYHPTNNPNGWLASVTILEGGDPNKVSFTSEPYTFGQDANGKWNQRLILRFPDTLMSTTQHTNMFFAKEDEPNEVLFIHKGIGAPFRMAVQFQARGGSAACGTIALGPTFLDDWSYSNTLDVGSNDKHLYFPISPSWFNYQSTYNTALSIPVNDVHVDACLPNYNINFDRLLVEEWDGYVWRRILGRGPVPGMEMQQVYVRDTLPAGLEWQGFVQSEALGIKATYDPATRVISWYAPTMLPGACGSLKYNVKAQSNCTSDIITNNRAWIYSSSQSKIDSAFRVTITCNPIPPPNPIGTTLRKTSPATAYQPGDDIPYTVQFKQTVGSIANPSLPNSNIDWTTHCGHTPINFNQTNAGTGVKLATYDYSHGRNGTLIARVKPELAQPFSLVFRHNGGSPACGPLQGLLLTFTNNSCSQLTVKLTQNNTLIGTKVDLSYPNPSDTLIIKVVLTDGRLQFWVNNFNVLPYEFTGITYLNHGYVGFYNSSEVTSEMPNPNHKLLYWYTNFDSAFEVSLKDPIVSNVTYNTSSISSVYTSPGLTTTQTTPIYSSGTNTINWMLKSGKNPMLYGDSVAFRFSVNVTNCPNGFVNNIVYANLRGVPTDYYGAQEVDQCGTVLPLTLLSFSGKTSTFGNILNWITADEKNVKGFYIERSTDGTEFENIGFIPSNSSGMVENYTFTDVGTISANYYRLRIMDHDGKQTYSNIIYLSSNQSVSIFPVPSNNSFTVKVQSPETFRYQVYSASGQLVERGTANQSVTVGNEYAQGVYTIQIITGDEVVVRKLVKE
jgi:uncharacterized repeat protein (TIGR01451 family)